MNTSIDLFRVANAIADCCLAGVEIAISNKAHCKRVTVTDVDYRRDKDTCYSVSTAARLKEANRLKAAGWKISVDMNLEKKATTPQRLDKCDIADIALEHAKQDHIERLKHP